ncbi:MAG: malonyl-ACP O-methyltransferase BioC [Acidiferrobacterales bacterium]
MSERLAPAGMLDKVQMRVAFERAAITYDAAAVLQREIAERMLERLDLIKCRPRRILDVGCGTGHCSRALERRYRRARIIGVDIAYAMTRAGQMRTRWRNRQRFVCADAEALPLADGSVDMVVSNLTLQWCDPDAVLRGFARVLRPGGVVMFTSFGPDTLCELRAAWQTVDERPHVHAFLDMHDLGDAVLRAGLADPVMDVEHFTLTYPDVLTLLRDLKNLGAHNVTRTRNRGLTGKRSFARFRSAYEAQARDGLIPATYEAIYGHAWAATAPAARVRADGSVSIPLAEIWRRER